jgi:hypothetical protein
MPGGTDDLTAPTPESIAAYVKRQSARARKVLAGAHAHGPPETVREFEYKGHRIVIGTTYRIKVDSHVVGGQFVVTDEGQVQCHALPNYTAASAVDLVKSMIDVFPEDFSGDAGGGGHGHGRRTHKMERSGAPRVAGGKAKPRSRAKKPTAGGRVGKRTSKGGRRGRH